jgi:hypothetical protein
VTILPDYDHPSRLIMYRTSIEWDERVSALRFAETYPNDRGEAGYVYIPPSSAFAYLLTIRQGYVRTVVVSQIVHNETIMRGLILCQAKVRGANWAPICSPIGYIKQKPDDAEVSYAVLDHRDRRYEDYRTLLREALTDKVVEIVSP